MSDENKHSPLGLQMMRDFAEVIDAIDSGEPLEGRFTSHKWTLDVAPHDYTPDDLKAVRAKLGASQSLLAGFLGVATKTLRCWEQGSRPVPAIAARFLDEIQEHPEVWAARLRRSIRRDGAPLPPSAQVEGGAVVEAESQP